MYFDKFPLLTYLKDLDGEVRRQLVTDVLRRVQIKTLGKEESTFFINYDMKMRNLKQLLTLYYMLKCVEIIRVLLK